MSWFSRIFGFPKISKNEEKIDSTMKYLITGLGNMAAEYDGTRHNVGFEVLDFLAKEMETPWKTATHGDLAEVKFKGRTFFLLKPSTWMNLSGKAVRYWLQKEKIAPENLLVISDDLNLPFGKLRMRPNGSDGGHNGLKSINELLGNNNYPRLRVGIGAEFGKGKQVNYVLGKWSKDEHAEMPHILKNCAEAIKTFGTIGLDRAMNQFNTK
jgi:peptidyl-tRNA hydrolase, PTH1 family